MIIIFSLIKELRHIWTDGYRKRNSIESPKHINRKLWYWASTGQRIPESGFIPWCVEDDKENTNCLNLDRENHKTPFVYGLNCRNNQSYVCQPCKFLIIMLFLLMILYI